MRQLVRDERNGCGIAFVVAGADCDIIAHGDCISAVRVGELCRAFATVNAHGIRIDAKQRAQESSR